MTREGLHTTSPQRPHQRLQDQLVLKVIRPDSSNEGDPRTHHESTPTTAPAYVPPVPKRTASETDLKYRNTANIIASILPHTKQSNSHHNMSFDTTDSNIWAPTPTQKLSDRSFVVSTHRYEYRPPRIRISTPLQSHLPEELLLQLQ